MAQLRTRARTGDSGRLSPLGIGLVVLGAGAFAAQRNGIVTALVGLALAVPALLVAVILWRRSIPHRATRVLEDLGATGRDGGGPRLRRMWKRGPVWHLAWRMPTGVTVSALTKRREAVEQALDASCDFWYDRGLFHMRAGVRRLPRLVKHDDFYRGATPPAGELVFGLGASREGPLWADLVDVLHLLVGGQTKKGKSVFVRQLLTRLLLSYGADHVQLVLIDLKGGLEFNAFEKLPHMMRPVARDLESCLAVLQAVHAELDRRQVAFDGAGVENIQRWNRVRAGQRLPYVLVVVDEFAELSAVESTDRTAQAARQDALSAVARLTRLGRATGFHVIVCTQRPDAKAVPGQIKANIPATVAFRVRANVNSEILLGDTNYAAAALPEDVRGRAVWQWDRETHFQAINLEKEHAERLLGRAYGLSLVPTEAGTASVTPCPTCPEEPAGEVA